jgi:hypothetical protein
VSSSDLATEERERASDLATDSPSLPVRCMDCLTPLSCIKTPQEKHVKELSQGWQEDVKKSYDNIRQHRQDAQQI